MVSRVWKEDLAGYLSLLLLRLAYELQPCDALAVPAAHADT